MNRFPGRDRTVEAVLGLPSAQQECSRLAQALRCDAPAARRKVRRCLTAMVATDGAYTERFGDRLGRLVTSGWEVTSDDGSRDTVRRLVATGTVIFLPNHRAYADPLFLRRVLRRWELPRNIWFAGDNLNDLPLISLLARMAGVVFLRRAVSGYDQTYRVALRLYFAHLLAGGRPLEWYLEGSRSRNGLPRPPKYGLLECLLEVARQTPGRPIWVVPVSLTHEPLPGAGALADEEKGAPKHRENVRWALRYLREQRRCHGIVRVRFGAPLRAADYLVSSSGRSGAAALGRDVQRAITQATPLTPLSLTAFALLDSRGGHTAGDVRRTLSPLLDAVERWDVPRAALVALRTPEGVREQLRLLCAAGGATEVVGAEKPSFSARPLLTRMYQNQCVHWFWPRAAAEVVALRACDSPGPTPWRSVLHDLRSILRLVSCGTGTETAPLLLDMAVAEFRHLTGPALQDGRARDVRKVITSSGLVIAPQTLRTGALSILAVLHQTRPLPDSTGLVAEIEALTTAGSVVVTPQTRADILLDMRRQGLRNPMAIRASKQCALALLADVERLRRLRDLMLLEGHCDVSG